MYSPNNLPLFCVISQKYFYMSVKERLKEFIKYKKISERKFCLAAGLTVTYVNNIRVSIQPDKIKSIAVAFPELNTGWMQTSYSLTTKEFCDLHPWVDVFLFLQSYRPTDLEFCECFQVFGVIPFFAYILYVVQQVLEEKKNPCQPVG